MNFSPRRWWPLAGVAGLLVAATVAAAHSSLRISRVEPPQREATELIDSLPEVLPPQPQISIEPQEIAAADQSQIPGWISTLAVSLCLITVVVIVGLLLRVLIRDLLRRWAERPPARETSPAAGGAEEVVAALDAGLVDLSDADADPRRAVIACWVRLEQAAAAVGTPRQVGDTPTDLVTRLLRGHAISADVLAAFAHVYREARYGAGTVDERMREQARSALRRLRAELTGQGPKPTGQGPELTGQGAER